MIAFLYLGPGGPLGYGSGGVYELDECFVPKKCIIATSSLPYHLPPYQVHALASDGRTIAGETAIGSPRLHIWTRDGKTKLREVTLEGNRFERRSLFSVPGGYVSVGKEIVWVPLRTKQPVVRFRLRNVPENEDHFGRVYRRSFDTPVFAGRHMFVSHGDGAIYVFDLGRWLLPE